MKKSLHDMKMMEMIDECIPYWQKINDLILWIPEEDLDPHTLAMRDGIRNHPLFSRNDTWPKTAIVMFLSNYQQEDDSCVKDLQKVTEMLNKYSGFYGLRLALDRFIANEELHMEVRTLLDTLRTKYRKHLRTPKTPVTRGNLKMVSSDSVND